MIATTQTFGEWLTEIKAIAADYDHAGVRVLPTETAPAVGESVANSYDWYEAEYGTGERIELDGACAISVEATYQVESYVGRYVALIAGSRSWGGDDMDERIIQDARVIALFDREA